MGFQSTGFQQPTGFQTGGGAPPAAARTDLLLLGAGAVFMLGFLPFLLVSLWALANA